MAYEQAVLRAAAARLSAARRRREEETEKRRHAIYKRIPRVAEIDRLLRRTMAQLFSAALREGRVRDGGQGDRLRHHLRLRGRGADDALRRDDAADPLDRLARGVALANNLFANAGRAGLDRLGPRLGHVGNLHRATTNNRAAAGAGTKLGEGHSDRHRFLFLSRCRCKASSTDTRFTFAITQKVKALRTRQLR